MRPSGFFFIYSFLSIVFLAEVTTGSVDVGNILEGTIIYAVIIPLGVAVILLTVAIAYEYLNFGRAREYTLKAPMRNLLKTAWFLGMGVFFSVIPSLMGHYLNPITGWMLLPLVIFLLYKLDRKMGGSKCSSHVSG
ncbi:hypothetical protein PNA2_1450 [Pyrococcus sp. NA2]|nr:hypothetical protein PNA2_1450 [Pyrococcus sp. NA2]